MSNTASVEQAIEDINNETWPNRVHVKLIDGEKFWFKVYSFRNYPFGRVAHRLFSFIVRQPFLKATKLNSPTTCLQRELKKAQDFRDAGFLTPQIMAVKHNIVAMKDAGTAFQEYLAPVAAKDADLYDKLLCEWAGQYGKLHAKGLCHGRPHLRDIIFQNNQWIFLDFEEQPEDVMPLATAQARDLLLIFHVLSRKIRVESNLEKALLAYSKHAPREVLIALHKILQDIEPIIKLAKFLSKLHSGSDIKRFISATDFLKQNLEIT